MKTNILKLFTLSTLLVSTFSNACVLTSVDMKNNKLTNQTDKCNIEFKAIDDVNITLIAKDQQDLKKVDFTAMDSSKSYIIHLNNNKSLKRIKLGNIYNIDLINISNTKIKSLLFMSNVSRANIYVNQRITTFPNNSSIFCKSYRKGMINIKPFLNDLLADEACRK